MEKTFVHEGGFFEIFLGTASVSVLLEAETATRLGKILFKQDLFSGKSK